MGDMNEEERDFRAMRDAARDARSVCNAIDVCARDFMGARNAMQGFRGPYVDGWKARDATETSDASTAREGLRALL